MPVEQYSYLLVLLLFGAVLAFVGIVALLPLGMYRKVFGFVWPVDDSESQAKVLQRRLAGIVLTALGFIALRAGLAALGGNLFSK